LLHANQPLPRHASLAHKDLPDRLDPQDLPETQERLVLPEDPDTMLPPDLPDHEDLPAHPERLDLLDPLESPVSQPSANHSLPASLESPETLDHLDPPDHLANPVWTAHQDPPDPRESLALPENLVPTAKPDPQEPLDQPELLARRVSARNTVPSTVVSSSKTALAAKKFNNRVQASSPRSAEHLHVARRCFSAADLLDNTFRWARVDDVAPTSSLFLLLSFLYASSYWVGIIYIPLLPTLFVYSHTQKSSLSQLFFNLFIQQ